MFYIFTKILMNEKVPELKIEWAVSVGSKWQIVIPKSVREKFDLTAWTDLIVLSVFSATILIKSEKLGKMISHFEKISQLFKNTPTA